MASPFTTYKLIILYMLQNSEGDLTNSQITDFILDRKYTNYFQLQQAVSELVEADLVEMSSQSNRTYYRLTEEGKNTLKYFSKELSSDIKKEVEEYLNSLHCKIEEHLLTPADYYPTREGSYSVRLRIIEGGVSIVDLSIKVPNLAAAQSVCESWPYKSPERLRQNNGGASLKGSSIICLTHILLFRFFVDFFHMLFQFFFISHITEFVKMFSFVSDGRYCWFT